MAGFQSKQEQVCAYILRQIQQEALKPGDRVPSEKQLCDRFGVSRITAQNALNQLERRGTIYRVRGSGSFVGKTVSPAASVLPMIMNSLEPEGRNMEMIEGAGNYLTGVDCHTAVYPICADPEKERKIFWSLLEKGHRSFLVLPGRQPESRDLYFDLIRKGVHLVFLDIRPDGLSGNLISCDNAAGGFLLTEHLIRRGYRRIAAIAPAGFSTVTQRLQGYRYALARYGLPEREDYALFLDDTGEPFFDTVSKAVEHLLSLPDRPDALFCLNDQVAVTACACLYEHGIRIPEDMALAGFDNLPAARECAVPLTTVEQPFAAMGYEAARLCYALREQEHTGRFSSILLPVRLIVRQSTAERHGVKPIVPAKDHSAEQTHG